MYVIAGATGHVGSAAANDLLAKNAKVRVIVRDEAKGAPWKKRGAEVAVGSLDDLAFVTHALTGATGAFLLLPPDYTAADPIAKNRAITDLLAAAVAAAKLPHVVLLSSVGANLPDGTGPVKALHYAEAKLAEAGAVVTALRAAYFQENYGNVLAAVTGQSILPSFLDENTAYPMVATLDLGRAAARALLDPPSKSRPLELAGPKDYTPREVADLFTKLLGKPIQLVNIPEPGHQDALSKSGLPPQFASLFAEMYSALLHRRMAFQGTPTRGEVPLDQTLAALLKK